MITHPCHVPHKPPHSYGDCVRACIASIMDIDDPLTVPHFFHDGPAGKHEGMGRITEWFLTQGYLPFWTAYGDYTLYDLLEMMEANNPNVHYVLFGGTDTGEHCVVCCGGHIVHNPGLAIITRPNNDGIWVVMSVARP